jgi:hypothetical protein
MTLLAQYPAKGHTPHHCILAGLWPPNQNLLPEIIRQIISLGEVENNNMSLFLLFFLSAKFEMMTYRP